MAEFVAPKVERLSDSGDAGIVSLLVGCAAERDVVEHRIEALAPEKIERVGQFSLRVTIGHAKIDELCDTPGIGSIEPDDTDVYAQTDS